jgi:hypothetical protein
MKCLEELGFSHEPGKRTSPSFAKNMDPFQIDPRKLNPGQRQSFTLFEISIGLFHDEVDELASIGFNQPARDSGLVSDLPVRN